MKHFSALFVAIGLMLTASACVQAASQSVPSLRPDAPQCKMPKAKLPRLGVDPEYDRPTEIKADSNGDALGTLKKSDDAARDAVLNYFYSVIEKPCSTQK